ncbi:MAG TPA: potassium channel family protein [Terriglobia bacterium]|nr:potassium channel family protein [Terriglobia bacterium]
MIRLGILGGLLILAVILWDAFETIILPRRVMRRVRLTRMFYRFTWLPWRALARRMRSGKRKDTFLSYYGPLSLLGLFGVWALGLIVAFALLQWGLGSPVSAPPGEVGNFWTDLYFSGTSFFTLGLGDVAPRTPLTRAITVAEAGTGFGFLAIVISYLPVLYGAFSRREVNISLLDARAGSPPTVVELLRRNAEAGNLGKLDSYLRDWELWSAELMESHLSYPVLCYYRSQHNNQSWLAALTTVLDGCALTMAYTEGVCRWQARLTFAISRHALVDLAQTLGVPPHPAPLDRLPAPDFDHVERLLARAGLILRRSAEADRKFAHLREMYEPFAGALAARLVMSLPAWFPAAEPVDNWRTSAWGRSDQDAVAGAALPAADEEHS